jgi:hypothetical protein
MNDFNTQQQCDEFISGDDFLLWVEAMEAYEASRDEADREWDEKFREIDAEWLDNQPTPW